MSIKSELMIRALGSHQRSSFILVFPPYLGLASTVSTISPPRRVEGRGNGSHGQKVSPIASVKIILVRAVTLPQLAGHEVLSWKNRIDLWGWLAVLVTEKDLSITGVLALRTTSVQKVHDIVMSSDLSLFASIQELTQRGDLRDMAEGMLTFRPLPATGPPTSLWGWVWSLLKLYCGG